MLSRRHLRIRVLQALYAWHQSEDRDTIRATNELVNGTSRMYDLYLYLLQFFVELAHREERYYADTPASVLTGKSKTADRLLSGNLFISWLANDKLFQKQVNEKKISWQKDADVIDKAFFQLRKSSFYKQFSTSSESISDIEVCKKITGDFLNKKEYLVQAIEEKNIYWAEGLKVISEILIRTIESGSQSKDFVLEKLYKDPEEDLEFMKTLLQKTILNDAYFTELITARTTNWDADRIALMDTLLMKMALCEILYISNIPVKVSINEYIDISKDYSTPNSKGFINGVVDNIVIALKKEGKIVKTGRGLIE